MPQLLAAVAAGLGMLVPQSALAGGAPSVDLRSEFSTVVIGAGTVAPAGDVNGDGLQDLVVSGARETNNAGRSWVLFAPFEKRIDVQHLREDQGFAIFGPPRAHVPQTTAVGDVNGDGLDDVVIGAHETCNFASDCDVTYVVFGKEDGAAVDLSDIGVNPLYGPGFRILGAGSWDVAGGGDINRDGLADVLVGYYENVYVVFGRSSYLDVDLEAFDEGSQGSAGYVIKAHDPEHGSPEVAVSGTGDVNGDVVPDVVMGYVRNDNTAGRAYVVFGKSDESSVDVTRDLSKRYLVHGIKRTTGYGSWTGYAVAGAGDVNGDGLADTVVAAPNPARRHRVTTDTYIVFGKPDTHTVFLRRLGRHGIRVTGRGLDQSRGAAVATVGDANGDGIEDLAIGAPRANRRGRYQSGSAYVVYGVSAAATIRLGAPDYGFRIDGPTGETHCRRFGGYCGVGAYAGTSVAPVGDVNGDGLDDVAVGAPYAGRGPRSARGKTFIVSGR